MALDNQVENESNGPPGDGRKRHWVKREQRSQENVIWEHRKESGRKIVEGVGWDLWASTRALQSQGVCEAFMTGLAWSQAHFLVGVTL